MREDHNRYVFARRSGIRYTGLRDKCSDELSMNLDGEEIIDDLNPFTLLYESSANGTALGRIYETRFRTAIEDTFFIFTGNHFDMLLTGKGRVGVLDLLLFPLMSRRLMYYVFRNPPLLPPLPKFVLACVALLLELVRFTLAALCTIAVSPLVFLIHLALKPFQKIESPSEYESRIFELKREKNYQSRLARNQKLVRCELELDKEKLEQCSENLRVYVREISKREKTFREALENVTISEEDKELICSIEYTPPEIPVRLNGRLYNLNALFKLEKNALLKLEKPEDPFTRAPFLLTDIVPAYDAFNRSCYLTTPSKPKKWGFANFFKQLQRVPKPIPEPEPNPNASLAF